MKINPLHQTDFYKTGHIYQYPEGTTKVYSNFTPRSDKLAPIHPDYFDGKVVFFGLQAFIKDFLINVWNEGFFNLPKEKVLSDYKRRCDNALGPDAVGVEHIAALHDLQYLPIEIKALPEGSKVNMKVPVLTITNTLPEFYWLTNYLETVISNELWKQSTVATIAYTYRKILLDFANLTGSPLEFVDWQGHDFSCRGMSNYIDAMKSGAAHLLSFNGTDTIATIDYLEEFYNVDVSNRSVSFGSVVATEHSVMCMGGNEDEIGTFKRLITDVYPKGIVSIVSDTWDLWKVVTEYVTILKDDILSRDGTVTFRPDSGDPVEIVSGIPFIEVEVLADVYDNYKVFKYYGHYFDTKEYLNNGKFINIPESQVKGVVECLWDVFGGTLTSTGHKLLDSHVKVIYGDSITQQRAIDIYSRLEEKGFASANLLIGIGSFSYTGGLTRDSFGFAVKATYGIVNGVSKELYKDPVTDSGTKKSAKGLLRVEKEGDDFVLYDQQTLEQEKLGELKIVFKDGVLVKETSYKEIKENLHNF